MASRMTVRLTLNYWLISFCSVASFSPLGRRPLRISRANHSATCAVRLNIGGRTGAGRPHDGANRRGKTLNMLEPFLYYDMMI